MDKDPKVGMPPPPLLELKSGNVSVTTPMTLGVHTAQPDNLLMYPGVNGVHLKVGEKCHPDLLDTNTVAAKDGSGDQLNNLHLSILKGEEESCEKEILEDKSSPVVDGSGDFSSSVKHHNNGWSPKLQTADSSESVGSGPSNPDGRLSGVTNETETEVVSHCGSNTLHSDLVKQRGCETSVVECVDQKDHGSPVADDSFLNSNSEVGTPQLNGLDRIVSNKSEEKKDECLGEVFGDINEISKSLFLKNNSSEKNSVSSGETFPLNTRRGSLSMDLSCDASTKSYARRSLSLPESQKQGDALLQGQDAALSCAVMDIDDQETITNEIPSSIGKLYTGMAFKEIPSVFPSSQHSIDALSECVHMQSFSLNNSKRGSPEKEIATSPKSPNSRVVSVPDDDYESLFKEEEKEMHGRLADLNSNLRAIKEDLCEVKWNMTHQRIAVVSTQAQLDLVQNSCEASNPSNTKVSTEQVSTNSGVLLKELKRFEKDLDPYMTDGTSDDDECFNNNPLPVGKRVVSQSDNVIVEAARSDLNNESTSAPHTSRKHEALKRVSYGRMRDGQISHLFSSEFSRLREDLRTSKIIRDRVTAEKGAVELEDPIPSASPNSYPEVIDVGGNAKVVPCSDAQTHFKLTVTNHVRHDNEEVIIAPDMRHAIKTDKDDGTKVCARARPLKCSSYRKREYVKLHASTLPPARKFDYRRVVEKNDPMSATIDMPLRHHTPFQRFDGKFLDASEPSFTMWASMHYTHYRPLLSTLSDVPLDCYVNAYMQSNRGWHNGIVSKSNITAADKRRDERDVPRGTVPNTVTTTTTVVNNDPRLRHRTYHPRLVDRCKSIALQGDDRENRKRRGSTHSLDNKRIRTASGDSDVEARSGASTPTYLEHSMSFQNQMKRKRNADGTYCLENVISHGMSSHKIERLKYKDIETPRWEKVDPMVYLQVQSGGPETQDELELEKIDQSASAYRSRHDNQEVLEKKKFNAYIAFCNNKKDGKNRVGSRANLPTSSHEFLQNERSASCHKAETTSATSPTAASGENPINATATTTTNSPSVTAAEPALSGSAGTPPSTPNEKQSTSLLASPSASRSPCIEPHPNDPGDGYWDVRTFPLSDEETVQLTKRCTVDSTPHARSYNHPRFNHLGEEGMKLPRIDTNTAPKYEKNHGSSGMRHKRRHRNSTNNRKNSTSSQKSVSKRKKKSKKDVYDEDAFSADERTDYESPVSEYDSEQTLTCSESDNEYYPEDHVYKDKHFHQFPPKPSTVRRKSSTGDLTGAHDRDYNPPKSTERRRGFSQSKNKKS